MKFKKWKKIQKLDQNTKIISKTLETKSMYLSKNPIMNHYFTSFVSKKWSLKLVERPLMRFLHLLSSHFRRVWSFFCYFFLSEKKPKWNFMILDTTFQFADHPQVWGYRKIVLYGLPQTASWELMFLEQFSNAS